MKEAVTIQNFTFIPCGEIQGLYQVEPKVYGDDRGYFMETYQREVFRQGGIDAEFVQDNQSSSSRGVLRGLHFQKNHPQGKLVRVVRGEVYDVAVDMRKDSPTRGQHFGVILTAEKKNQFYLPPGFAHGFLVLSKMAEFTYKCTDYYHPEDEGGLMWNDPDLNISWPIPAGMELLLSPKDQQHPGWKELA